MENLVLSTNSWDEETFIYLTREYKNNFCLNEFEIGIGKADDPLRRWKEHNAASSKSTVKIAFEYIYLVKTKEYERQLHKRLISMGFTNIEKEVFSGTNNNGQTLTIEFLNNIIEKEALDGPWAINDGKIITTKNYQEIKNKKEIESAELLFVNSKQYNPGLINQLKTALDNNIIQYQYLAQQYKNDFKIIIHAIDKNLIKLQDIPNNQKFELNILLALYKNNIIDFHYIQNNTNLIFDSTNKYNKDNIQDYINEEHIKIEKRKQEIERGRILQEKILQKQNKIQEIKENIKHGKIKILPDNDFYRDNPQLIDFALVNYYLTIFDIHSNLLKDYLPYSRINIERYIEFLLKNNKYIINGFLNQNKVHKAIKFNKSKQRLLFFNIFMMFLSPLLFITITGANNIILPSHFNEIIPYCLPAVFVFLMFLKLPNEKLFLVAKYLNKEIGTTNNHNKITSLEVNELNQALKGNWTIPTKEYKTNEQIRNDYNFKKDY